uniref:Uncharacterized protein n=1 Tax=Anguilla anguilla TaxID=7936 RepID=A0A0E9TXX4_ANGAN
MFKQTLIRHLSNFTAWNHLTKLVHTS